MAVNQDRPTISAGEAGIGLNLAWRFDGEGPRIDKPAPNALTKLQVPEKPTPKKLQLIQRAREALKRIEEAAHRGRRRLVLPRSHR